MGAEFKVIKIDPDGSGTDFAGHLGYTVRDAKRCCKNCSCIWGIIGDNSEIGPFVMGELSPLNKEAEAVLFEIRQFLAEQRALWDYRKKHPIQIVYSEQFKKSYEKIVGKPLNPPEQVYSPPVDPKKDSS